MGVALNQLSVPITEVGNLRPDFLVKIFWSLN